MSKETGFMEYRRLEAPHRPVSERVGDYFEIALPMSESDIHRQAARCSETVRRRLVPGERDPEDRRGTYGWPGNGRDSPGPPERIRAGRAWTSAFASSGCAVSLSIFE